MNVVYSIANNIFASQPNRLNYIRVQYTPRTTVVRPLLMFLMMMMMIVLMRRIMI